MLTIKPDKKSAIFIYLILFSLTGGLSFVAIYFKDFLGVITTIIVLILWAITITVAFFLIPAYYINTRIIISTEKIIKQTFFITHKHTFMSQSSIASITIIITPLSRFTGLNAIIINALGARLLIPFLSKSDCKLIQMTIDK